MSELIKKEKEAKIMPFADWEEAFYIIDELSAPPNHYDNYEWWTRSAESKEITPGINVKIGDMFYRTAEKWGSLNWVVSPQKKGEHTENSRVRALYEAIDDYDIDDIHSIMEECDLVTIGERFEEFLEAKIPIDENTGVGNVLEAVSTQSFIRSLFDTVRSEFIRQALEVK